MCSSPHWQVGQSWFREKLSPANREQRLSRWADFAKNCLPRIRSKVLPRFREKYRALGRQKMGSNMRPRYIQFRDIHDRDISGLHCTLIARRMGPTWAHLGPIGPRWAPCWPHEPCYLGTIKYCGMQRSFVSRTMMWQDVLKWERISPIQPGIIQNTQGQMQGHPR